MDPFEVAAALRAMAERIEHLPAHDRRRPDAFTEAKSELAADVMALAEILTARRDPPPAPRPRLTAPRRPISVLFRKIACHG